MSDKSAFDLYSGEIRLHSASYKVVSTFHYISDYSPNPASHVLGSLTETKYISDSNLTLNYIPVKGFLGDMLHDIGNAKKIYSKDSLLYNDM